MAEERWQPKDQNCRPPSLLRASELTPPYPADSPGEQEAVLRNHIHAYFNSNVDIPEVMQGPWTHAGRVGQGSQVLLPSQVPASADLPVKAASAQAVAPPPFPPLFPLPPPPPLSGASLS